MKFKDALKESIKYLQSDEFKKREDAEDTLPQIDNLIKINELGLLTIGSQQGRNQRGYNPDTKRYYETRERAQLMGFMPRVRGSQLIEYLNSHTDKIAFFVHSQAGKEFEKIFYEGNPELIPNIPITVSASSLKKEKLTKFYSDSTIQTIFPESLYNLEKKRAHLNKSEDVLFIIIIDPVYGRKAPSINGLYKDLFNALKTIAAK